MTRPAEVDRLPVRYDTTLRVVMWLDAFFSTVAALAWLVLLPAVVMLDLPTSATTVAGLVALVGSLFLGGCGAVTFWVLMLRTRHGDYLLPDDLRLPLPAAFRAWSNDADASSAG